MKHRIGRNRAILVASVAGVIATAAIPAAHGQVAQNQTQNNTSSSYFATPAPLYLQEAKSAWDEGLMQEEMRSHGMGGDYLDNNGIKINGYVNAGLTYNWQQPFEGFNGPGRLFDDKEQDPRLDQLSITVMRDVEANPDRFDTGFTLQVIYGADVRFIQANGTNFYGSGSANRQVPLNAANPHLLVITPGQEFPENQIDIFQAFVTFNLPYAGGVLLTAGKFETPWGVEHVEPTRNGLYSHSYIFGLSQPFTLTGLAADWRYDDQWTFKGGIVVGWDQSLQDNNDFPSFFVQTSYKLSSEWSFVLSYMTGPEKPDNRSDWRQLVDLTAEWKLAPEWTVDLEGVAGWENDVGTKFTSFSNGQPLQQPQRVFTFDDVPWFGAAAYSTYKIDEDGRYTLVLRGEYFNDNAGGRQLITEAWAATLGLNWVPFVNDRIGKNLMLRPEVRVDWTQDKVFDADQHQTQITMSIDAIFKF